MKPKDKEKGFDKELEVTRRRLDVRIGCGKSILGFFLGLSILVLAIGGIVFCLIAILFA